MAITTRAAIDDFLAQKRIAFVGVSRDPRSFSRRLFRDLHRLGYDVVPVNPNVSEIDGLPCHARVQDIQPPVTAALLAMSREALYRPVLDCEEAGIRRLWIYGVNGPAQASVGACEFCAAHGIEVVAGYCPYMFFPDTGLMHRFHGCILKWTGHYPS